MIGSLLAGHDECLGEIVEEENKKYKLFYGMASETAMNKYDGGKSKYRSAEGKTVKIKYKGPVETTVDDILGGLRSTCTYLGVKEISDIHKNCTFIRVNRQVNTVHSGKEV